jgi:hypothetical protein
MLFRKALFAIRSYMVMQPLPIRAVRRSLLM